MAEITDKSMIKGLPEGAETQKIRGRLYVYFAYSFNVDGTKFQERDYIGKVVDGAFVPNAYYIDHKPDRLNRPLDRWKNPVKKERERQKAEILKIQKEESKVPGKDFEDGEEYNLSVGATAILMKVLDESSMARDVGKALDGDVRQTVDALNVAMHSALTNKANYMAKDASCDKKFIGKGCPSSQRISELHAAIGSRPQVEKELAKARCGHLPRGQLLALDGTRVDCNSEGISYGAKGKKKDGTYGRQINFSVLVNASNGQCLGYRIFAGNVPDTLTVEDFRHLWDEFGIAESEPVIIMGRGYYDEEDLTLLSNDGIGFIVGAKSNLDCVKEVVSERNNDFRDVRYQLSYRKCHGVSSTYTIRTRDLTSPCNLFVYHSQQKEYDEGEDFLKKLKDVEAKWRENPDIDAIPKGLRGFYIKPENGSLLVRNDDRIVEHCRSLGYFAFASNRITDVAQCYDYYEFRNEVELYFKGSKACGFKSTHVQSDVALGGYAFTAFLATSIIFDVMHRMRGNIPGTESLREKYTIKEMLSTMMKVRLVRRKNGEVYLTNVTRREKKIAADLGFAGLFDSAEDVEKLLSAAYVSECLKNPA